MQADPRARASAAKELRQYYEHAYGQGAEEARRNFITGRARVSAFIHGIVRDCGARPVLDVGCSYGVMVELCNRHGIPTWGLDLPLDELKQHHATLAASAGRFIYGTLDEDSVRDVRAACGGTVGTALVIDTLRHLPHPEAVGRLGASYLVIKEAACSRKALERWQARFSTAVRLWSPADLLELLPEYEAVRIYGSHGVGPLPFPGRTGLWAFNALFPSYTIVLRRRS